MCVHLLLSPDAEVQKWIALVLFDLYEEGVSVIRMGQPLTFADFEMQYSPSAYDSRLSLVAVVLDQMLLRHKVLVFDCC